jgi:hypothetical protein
MDKAKMVELHIDNIMRGLLKLNFYKDESRNDLLQQLMQGTKLYHNESKYNEFNQLTDKLYDLIFIYRASGQIQGELQEIENEKTIETLKQQVKNLDEANKRLAEEVLKYKTPEQKTDFKGVG